MTKNHFQLWNANDVDHRLAPERLLAIIALSENILGMEDLVIEVEYQSETIGKYDLSFNGQKFVLNSKNTNCLAQDKCGIPAGMQKVNITDLTRQTTSACTPGGGCC